MPEKCTTLRPTDPATLADLADLAVSLRAHIAETAAAIRQDLRNQAEQLAEDIRHTSDDLDGQALDGSTYALTVDARLRALETLHDIATPTDAVPVPAPQPTPTGS